MRHANRRDAAPFREIEPNQRLESALLPARQPREDEQARPIDLPVDTLESEGPATDSDAAHQPPAAGFQVRFHVGGFEPTLGAPPSHTLLRSGEGVEDSVSGGVDGDLLDYRIFGHGLTHRFSSRYCFRSRRVLFQKAR